MKQQKGFTLIELVVSMTIFAVISGFVLINFRQGQRSDEVRLAADNLAVIIREVLARATSGQKVTICQGGGQDGYVCSSTGTECTLAGGTCGLEQVPEGWGVVFWTQRAVIFADLNDNKLYNQNEFVEDQYYSQSRFVEKAGIDLPIVFDIPTTEAIIKNDPELTEVDIVLEHTAGGGQRTVNYNKISNKVEITNP